ncbi:hypothetical protein TrRE_jg7495, partial [Triparma retinervis]
GSRFGRVMHLDIGFNPLGGEGTDVVVKARGTNVEVLRIENTNDGLGEPQTINLVDYDVDELRKMATQSGDEGFMEQVEKYADMLKEGLLGEKEM